MIVKGIVVYIYNLKKEVHKMIEKKRKVATAYTLHNHRRAQHRDKRASPFCFLAYLLIGRARGKEKSFYA
jgi:hypothetical protein